MPRKPERKQIAITLSEQQFAVVHVTAQMVGAELSDYLRDLIRKDAQAKGVTWPEDLPHRGKYTRRSKQ